MEEYKTKVKGIIRKLKKFLGSESLYENRGEWEKVPIGMISEIECIIQEALDLKFPPDYKFSPCVNVIIHRTIEDDVIWPTVIPAYDCYADIYVDPLVSGSRLDHLILQQSIIAKKIDTEVRLHQLNLREREKKKL